ncbi:MAG: DUF1801 domain-containing protein [Ferruginibacter sp.]
MATKNIKTKKSDAELVNDYMDQLKHPLKDEIEAVRTIITSNKKISERIKWNAPSYYYKEDLVTFNPRNQKQVHLVFHNQAIVDIKSTLLEGVYKDRRMTYFDSMAAIKKNKKELEGIINEYINAMDKKSSI